MLNDIDNIENEQKNESSIIETMGGRIKVTREHLKLSRQQLCDVLSQSDKAPLDKSDNKRILQPGTLKAWENGDNPVEVRWLPAICDCLQCDISFLFGEHPCRTKDLQGVVEFSGLPEDAVETLHNLSDNAALFLEDLLSSPELLQEISSYYLNHWFAHHVMAPTARNAIDKNSAKLARNIKIDYSVNGTSLPEVPVLELEDYTRFQLVRSILHFVERDEIPSWVRRMEKAK